MSVADFRPPTMYYTSIPLVSERSQNKRWDATKLRELRKRLDSGTMTMEEVDGMASDFLDGEIVDLASDWLGNTVREKTFRIPQTINFLARLYKNFLRNAHLVHGMQCWSALLLI